MIYLTGDIHGHDTITKLASTRWPEGKTLTKDDYLIILGDFGLLWKDEPDANEKYWIDWLNRKPWTTLFLDGNHENHDRLYSLPIEKKFNGRVGKVSDSIFHLKRGEVYIINNNTFFVMGGAFSIDRSVRILDKSWWEAELPSKEEYEYGLDNLINIGNKVDYVLGHTTSQTAIEQMFKPRWLIEDPVALYFKELEKRITFKKFYFGHWHKDKDYKNYHALYHDIVLLGE